MKAKRIFSITITLIALLTLMIANAAVAAEQQDQTSKSDQSVASMEKVNINQADAKTLATLKGIGKDRALKIVEYREKNGPFLKIEDIMKVKGIGRKVFDRNKDALTV